MTCGFSSDTYETYSNKSYQYLSDKGLGKDNPVCSALNTKISKYCLMPMNTPNVVRDSIPLETLLRRNFSLLGMESWDANWRYIRSNTS